MTKIAILVLAAGILTMAYILFRNPSPKIQGLIQNSPKFLCAAFTDCSKPAPKGTCSPGHVCSSG